MAELAHFPTEILSGITQALDGFDIANMYLTGDARLRVLMENGGVTRFKLKLRQERTRKWPTLFNRFRLLDYLSIGPKSGHEIWFRDVDLLSLSRTLKHLQLNITNSEFVLLGIPYVIPDAHPDAKLSPPTDAVMTLSPLPIAQHFIELQTLTLKGQLCLPHILVSHLPQTLLQLNLPYTLVDDNFFPSLPPHLTSLELPKVDNLKEETIFPQNLTHLSLPSLETVTPVLLSHIPSSVTKLNLSCSDFDDPNLVDLLPPLLTSLVIDWKLSYNDDIRGRLPRSLRHLTMYHSETVTKLDLFPPALQTFATWESVCISDKEIALLPRTLTEVSLWTAAVSSDCLKFFPDSLRSLSLNVVFSIRQSPSPYGFMKTLEYLHIFDIELNALAFMPRLSHLEIRSFSGGDLGALKESSSSCRRLHISNKITLDLQFVRSLPPTLESLSIVSKNEVDPTVSQYLPRSLRTLYISGNKSISDLFVRYLPPGLIDLQLDKAKSLSDDAIRLLPRTLEVLGLSRASKITDEGILHLPPSLTDCRLSRASLLTDQSAPLFPRHMTRLYLDRCVHFSNKAIPYFPRSLTALFISENTNINMECVPHLPPLLKSVSIKNYRLCFPNYVPFRDPFVTSLASQKNKKK